METEDPASKPQPQLRTFLIGVHRACRVDQDRDRKLREFRRILQDPDSPGFMDPERAAAVVGIDLNKPPAREARNPGLLSWLPDPPNTQTAVVKTTYYRKALIEKARARMLEGLNATKWVVTFDDYGNRHTVEIPDHGQRRSYAKLALEVEMLEPTDRTTTPNPLPTAAPDSSIETAPDARNKMASLTAADRMLARAGTKRELIKDAARYETCVGREN